MSEINDGNWHDWTLADESRAQAEMQARRSAMPLRRMVGMKTQQPDFWELECGHFVPRHLPLDDNGCVPCQVCYAAGMLRAEKMLER